MANLKTDNKKTKHAKFSKKTNISYPRVRNRGLEIVVFRKIWRALFSCYLRFEIFPFALLPMRSRLLSLLVGTSLSTTQIQT